MATENFDVIVVGSGPAGYVAAIRCSQLGMKTAIVEKDKTLGGTCLNVGCIPSKALLDSSEHFYQAKTKFQKHGIVVGDIKVDLSQMMKRKDEVVKSQTAGLQFLMKKNKIEVASGTGKLLPKSGDLHQVEVTGTSNRRLAAPKVILATGSEPVTLPFLPVDGKTIITSTEALTLSQIPKHLVVVGGGVIGLELGSVWMRLGAKVTVIEFQDHICGATDRQAANELQKSLTKQGMEFRLSTKCLGAEKKGDWMLVQVEDTTNGTKSQIECDVVLVSTGRRPYSKGLGLEAVGLDTDKMGRVLVDEHFQTKVPGIYAIGDLIPGPMLAHKGEEEGVAVAEMLGGQAGHVNYEAIPSVIYTWPELATVGYSEEELKAKGIEYRSGSYPFKPNGRARAMEESEGWVKILADAKTDRVLGAAIVGPWASDLIGEITSVMEFGGSSEDIARTCHAHPTLAEVVKEAALAVDKRALHA